MAPGGWRAILLVNLKRAFPATPLPKAMLRGAGVKGTSNHLSPALFLGCPLPGCPGIPRSRALVLLSHPGPDAAFADRNKTNLLAAGDFQAIVRQHCQMPFVNPPPLWRVNLSIPAAIFAFTHPQQYGKPQDGPVAKPRVMVSHITKRTAICSSWPRQPDDFIAKCRPATADPNMGLTVTIFLLAQPQTARIGRLSRNHGSHHDQER